MLTKTQINKLRKAMSQGVGSDIKISKTQIRKAIKHKKAIAPIAAGDLSGLASLGVHKIFGKGVQQGSFFIPRDKIAQLIAYKHLLSAGQKKDILNALQSGGQLVIKPTRTQQGGFLGTLLGSIGIPMILTALTEKGIQADRTDTANTMSASVSDNTTDGHGMINLYAYMSPPFVGTSENPVGMGIIKEEARAAAWQKHSIQFNPNRTIAR